MTTPPRVSVVMPSLNQGRFIRQAIESVLGQDYRPIELIVVDGRSADETLDILREYNGRAQWVSEFDAGQTAAVNKGFRMATGDIIGWLNGDDLFLPGAVRAGVEFLEAHPEVDLVYGDADHIDEEGRFIAPYPTEPFSLDRLRETCFICQPAVFFRRRVFSSVGFLDERLNCSMDYDYWIRIAKVARIVHRPGRLALSRLHAEAKTAQLRVEHQRASIEVVRRHFGEVPASWLCAYAVARLGGRLPRRTGWQRLVFAAAVTGISAAAAFQLDGSGPKRVARPWLVWLRKTVRPAGSRPSSVKAPR